jgi:hypothetical protein
LRLVPLLHIFGAILGGQWASGLGSLFQAVLDLREGFVDAEKDNQNLTVDPHSQGTQYEEQYALPQVMGLTHAILGSAIDYHHAAHNKAGDDPNPEQNLDDYGRNHGSEGPKIAHRNLLLPQIYDFHAHILVALPITVDQYHDFL